MSGSNGPGCSTSGHCSRATPGRTVARTRWRWPRRLARSPRRTARRVSCARSMRPARSCRPGRDAVPGLAEAVPGLAEDGPGRAEAVPGLAEGVALGMGEELGGSHRVDMARETFVVKRAVADGELPSSVPFAGPRLGQALERVLVGDPDGVALDDHIEPGVPLVAAGRQHHVRVGPQVDGLLLTGAGGEVD